MWYDAWKECANARRKSRRARVRTCVVSECVAWRGNSHASGVAHTNAARDNNSRTATARIAPQLPVRHPVREALLTSSTSTLSASAATQALDSLLYFSGQARASRHTGPCRGTGTHSSRSSGSDFRSDGTQRLAKVSHVVAGVHVTSTTYFTVYVEATNGNSVALYEHEYIARYTCLLVP